MTVRILITGGSGFTGRNLYEQMRTRYEVLVPRHDELELLEEEAVSAFLRRQRCDVVVHAAIKPIHRNAKDRNDLVKDNLRMFYNLARNASSFGRMIFIGSGAIYDARYYQPKMKEEHYDAHVPCDDTGLFKYAVAKFIEKEDRIVELRPFGLFGRHEDYAMRFISNMICKAICGLPLTVHQNRRMDYLYVDDLSLVVEHFLIHEAHHKAYNVTPDASVELCQLAELVLKVSGKNLPIVIARGNMGPEYSGDNGRLRREIHGLSFTPIEEAVRELYNWYCANRSAIDRRLVLADR